MRGVLLRQLHHCGLGQRGVQYGKPCALQQRALVADGNGYRQLCSSAEASQIIDGAELHFRGLGSVDRYRASHTCLTAQIHIERSVGGYEDGKLCAARFGTVYKLHAVDGFDDAHTLAVTTGKDGVDKESSLCASHGGSQFVLRGERVGAEAGKVTDACRSGQTQPELSGILCHIILPCDTHRGVAVRGLRGNDISDAEK